jgi:hypothetical protein
MVINEKLVYILEIDTVYSIYRLLFIVSSQKTDFMYTHHGKKTKPLI